MPPPVEICHLPDPEAVPPRNGRTYTSLRPDSLDVYAIQRPSGEKAGSCSLDGVRRKSSGLPGLGYSGSLTSKGSVQRLNTLSTPDSAKARRRPSGENEYGITMFLPSSNGCASPAPSARAHR